VLDGPGLTGLRVRLSPDGRDCWTLAGSGPDGRPVATGTVTLRPLAAAASAAQTGTEHRDALLRIEWQEQQNSQDEIGQDAWVTVAAGVPGVDCARVTELGGVRDPVPGVVICPVTSEDGEMPAAADGTAGAVLRLVQA
jgi:hypothetical protein